MVVAIHPGKAFNRVWLATGDVHVTLVEDPPRAAGGPGAASAAIRLWTAARTAAVLALAALAFRRLDP